MLHYISSSVGTLRRCSLHSHDAWEVVLNVEGSGVTRIAGREYDFGPGNIVCIPPGMMHDKQSSDGFCDLYLQMDAPRSAAFSTDAPTLLTDDSEGSLETLMRMMLRKYYDGSAGGRAAAQSLYQAALLMMTDWAVSGRPEPMVERVRSRMIAEFTNPEISVSGILSETGYSVDYVRRRFCDELGETPMEFLTRLRVDYARELLSRRKQMLLSVADVASLCGYYDVRYFSRVFRKVTGQTPGEYTGLMR